MRGSHNQSVHWMYEGDLGYQMRGKASVLHNHCGPVDTLVAGDDDESAHMTNFVELEAWVRSPHLPSQCTPHGIDAENRVQSPMSSMADMNGLWMRGGYHIWGLP